MGYGVQHWRAPWYDVHALLVNRPASKDSVAVDQSIHGSARLTHGPHLLHPHPVTLGEIRNVIQQNKPNYYWDKEVVCAMEDGIWCVNALLVYSRGSIDSRWTLSFFVGPSYRPPTSTPSSLLPFSCPAYCCDIMSTVHGLQKPMNMTFRKEQVRARRKVSLAHPFTTRCG